MTIVYGNHVAFEAMPSFGRFISLFSRRIKIVARKNIVDGWLGLLVGKAAAASGLLLLIDREVRANAVADLERGLSVLKPGTVLVILPDRHRPSLTPVDITFEREHQDRRCSHAKSEEILQRDYMPNISPRDTSISKAKVISPPPPANALIVPARTVAMKNKK